MIFAMRQVQEKCIEQNKPLYSVFIAMTKAFDTVNREALWIILTHYGCLRKFMKLIQLLHKGMTGQVLYNRLVSMDKTDPGKTGLHLQDIFM